MKTVSHWRYPYVPLQLRSALAALFLSAPALRAPARVLVAPLTASPKRGELLEFRIDGLPATPTPCTAEVNATVTAPSGKSLTVPAFWMAPHKAVQHPDSDRRVHHMRFFVTAADWRKNEQVSFLIANMTLIDAVSGKQTVVDAFNGPLRWKSQGATLSRTTHEGIPCMKVDVTIGDNAWPGCSLDLHGAEWTGFDQLRFRVAPLRGTTETVPRVEYYLTDKRKFIARVESAAGGQPGTWRDFTWTLPSTRRPATWEASGEPQWRLRVRPSETGSYSVKVLDGSAIVRVSDAPFDGYIRPQGMYLAFESGRPYFPVGTNLLGNDLGTYRHYLEKLAGQGGNFIRIWLSPRTMGFDTKNGGPHEYGQGRAAQLDALLDLCAEKGIYVMACITDFREVCSFHENSDWKNSPYNAINGGSCTAPENFFTAPEAKRQYRDKLRYLVARYGHADHVLAWEFFNEVNITDGWRKRPDAVRAWHAEMAAYLNRIDPQHHIITSSFAGIADDALWQPPLMGLVQRHEYIDGEQSFPAHVADAHAALLPHGKPVLMGEFGRRKNHHAASDHEGVSLHNGMWAAIHSGACGTAMTWWWEWIDTNDLWPLFGAVSRYVEGIDWPSEHFRVVPGGAVSADPDPKYGFGAVSYVPTESGWKPAPYNTPVTVQVRRDGTFASDKPLPRILHGIRAHKPLHNPVTLQTRFDRATPFALVVGDVSGYSGAALEMRLDGEVALRKPFSDTHPDDQDTLTEYAGAYTIDVPAGRHTIVAENTGADWFTVRRYEFGTSRPTPPVRVFSVRGKRTVLVWIWNESHAWYRPVFNTPLIRPRDVRITVSGLTPGTYRRRPFDPWKGVWSEATTITVSQDGTAVLAAGDLPRDTAFRLERVK